MGYLGSKYYDNRIQNTSRSFEDIAESVKMSNQSLSFYELVKFGIYFSFREVLWNQTHKFVDKRFLKDQ